MSFNLDKSAYLVLPRAVIRPGLAELPATALDEYFLLFLRFTPCFTLARPALEFVMFRNTKFSSKISQD